MDYNLIPFLSAIPQAWVAVIVLALMFYGFLTEKLPAEVIAFIGAVIMLALGIVQLESFEVALANPAPWTIAALFVLSGALTRTGVIALFSNFINRMVEKNPKRTVAIGAIAILILSAFMNNTPLLVIMLPIVIRASKSLGVSVSKTLIPLSYLTILGGMLTLLGTSTNLLVSGIAYKSGLEQFSVFEVTPLALSVVTISFIYVVVFVPRLLPVRTSMSEVLIDRKMSFHTEVAVPENSSIIGRKIMEVELFKREGMRVIDVIRNDKSIRWKFPDVEIEAGDRVVLKTNVDELLSLKESSALQMVDRLTSRKTTTVEALITPDCNIIGRRLGDLRLRRRYSTYPLAVHRQSQNLGTALDDIVIRVGDTLLLEGAPEDISRMSHDLRLMNLAETTERAFRRNKAPYVLAIWLCMLLVSSLNIMPIFFAALVALALVMIIGAIDIEEAIESVEGKLLVLIFSMIVVASGLESSGAIDLVVNAVAPYMMSLPHFMIIGAVFVFSSILTEILSNNAIAVVMTPVVISLAYTLGVDPRGLVVAVMLAASCSFATPIGYQTNTMVYGPGGYKFMDFVRVGVPLNILTAIVGSLLIPIFFPL